MICCYIQFSHFKLKFSFLSGRQLSPSKKYFDIFILDMHLTRFSLQIWKILLENFKLFLAGICIPPFSFYGNVITSASERANTEFPRVLLKCKLRRIKAMKIKVVRRNSLPTKLEVREAVKVIDRSKLYTRRTISQFSHILQELVQCSKRTIHSPLNLRFSTSYVSALANLESHQVFVVGQKAAPLLISATGRCFDLSRCNSVHRSTNKCFSCTATITLYSPV